MSDYARDTDPGTSHEAAASITASLPWLEQRVLQAIEKHEDGATLDELVDDTGLDKVTVSPRLRPLCEKGLVTTAGKRPGKAGRQQTIWKKDVCLKSPAPIKL